MIKVDLTKIRTPNKAINWVLDTWGPQGERWRIVDLAYLEFKKDRDASLFLVHWG